MDGLRARADEGDEHAARELAGLLAERGDLDETAQIMHALAEAGDVDGLRARAEAGDAAAAGRLVGLLAERGDPDELAARADDGDSHAARELAGLLAGRGDLDGLRARTDAGDGIAARRLIDLLSKQGCGKEAALLRSMAWTQMDQSPQNRGTSCLKFLETNPDGVGDHLRPPPPWRLRRRVCIAAASPHYGHGDGAWRFR